MLVSACRRSVYVPLVRRLVMPDLAPGPTVEIQGSAAQPYVLKHVGGFFSLSCPACRNQSLPIDKCTCKHLRQYRGNAAEAARIGPSLPVAAAPRGGKPTAPALLLAQAWDHEQDLTGWWL